MRPLLVFLLWSSVITTWLSASGCGDDATCSDCAPITFGVEVVGGRDGPVALVDGATIPWVWGPQGGTMILEKLVFDPADAAAGDMIEVTVRHSPDPGAPDRFGQVSEFLELRQLFEVFADVDGRPVAGPINDQLGWTELDGTRLTWAIDIAGSTFATSTLEAVIELAPMPVNTSCEPFAVEGDGCTYRAIPGTATVTSIATPTGYTCTDGSKVTLAFEPDDPTNAEACAAALSAPTPLPSEYSFTVGSGASPPTSCLTPLGITMDAALPATLTVIERGTCSPLIFRLELDTSSCDAMCF